MNIFGYVVENDYLCKRLKKIYTFNYIKEKNESICIPWTGCTVCWYG